MDPFAEVLVHISAPSGVADDNRYRAQVDAILGFQCVSRQAIITSAGSDEDTQDNGDQMTEQAVAPRPGIQSTEPHASDSLDSSLVSVIPDSQPPQGSPPPKRPRIHPPSPPAALPPGDSGHSKKTGDPQQPSNTSPRTQQQPPAPPTQGPPTTTTLTLPLHIHAPNPPPSTAPFTTHITPTLAMLTSRLKSPRTYSPVQQTRALTNLERGHWTVPINLIITSTPPENNPQDPLPPNTWPLPLFTRFWAFLSSFITEGRAGWGVWCSLEADTTTTTSNNEDHTSPPHPHPHPQNPLSQREEKEEEQQSTLTTPSTTIQPTTLKVYAWGETAQHVYLLLFLASERQIRRMGARWRDSRGDVIIEM